jgi:proteasome lid subunit RPN8/RPN11
MTLETNPMAETAAACEMALIHKACVDEMVAHAVEANPQECCGIVGGIGNAGVSVHRLRNVARHRESAYDAAPEDLFAAQKSLRDRGEILMGIYHSHPRSDAPYPSETDIRLAYYPEAFYFIIGLRGTPPALRAFRIDQRGATVCEVGLKVIETK